MADLIVDSLEGDQAAMYNIIPNNPLLLWISLWQFLFSLQICIIIDIWVGRIKLFTFKMLTCSIFTFHIRMNTIVFCLPVKLFPVDSLSLKFGINISMQHEGNKPLIEIQTFLTVIYCLSLSDSVFGINTLTHSRHVDYSDKKNKPCNRKSYGSRQECFVFVTSETMTQTIVNIVGCWDSHRDSLFNGFIASFRIKRLCLCLFDNSFIPCWGSEACFWMWPAVVLDAAQPLAWWLHLLDMFSGSTQPFQIHPGRKLV